jgi:hypothetical protein
MWHYAMAGNGRWSCYHIKNIMIQDLCRYGLTDGCKEQGDEKACNVIALILS